MGVGRDAGRIPGHDRGAGHAEAEFLAVTAGDADLGADPHVAEKRKAGVAMRRVDGGARLARLGRALDMAGAERERLAARAGERDLAAMQARHLDAGDRPGVGPGPRLYGGAIGHTRRERAL